MLSAGVQKKLDRIAEIREDISALELELEQLLSTPAAAVVQKKVRAKKESSNKKSSASGRQPCDECGSMRRHFKTCSLGGKSKAQDDVEKQEFEEPQPQDIGDALTSDQFSEVHNLLKEEGLSSHEIADRTGYELKEVNAAITSRKYGMYLFNRKKR